MGSPVVDGGTYLQKFIAQETGMVSLAKWLLDGIE